MNPRVFTILNASPAVKAVFGTAPLRVFPWGTAPENTLRPYATYVVFDALPENTLGETPDVDVMSTQIDVWADTGGVCDSASQLIRDALEAHAHMTSFSMSPPDEETELYRQRMDFDFFEER